MAPRPGAPRLAVDAVLAAVRRLTAPDQREGFRRLAVYTYTRADGAPWLWKVRTQHPVTGETRIHPMRCENGNFELALRTDLARPGVGMPLYRVHRLNDGEPPTARCAQGFSRPVWIVGNEREALALETLVAVATTPWWPAAPGRVDWSPLRGRRAVLWLSSGTADDTARVLLALGCAVEFVDESEAPGAWLQRHPDATRADLEALPRRAARPEPALDAARRFLRGLLAAGPMPAQVVRAAATDGGHTWATLRRAARDIFVVHAKERGPAGGWTWSLPMPQVQAANPEHLEHLMQQAAQDAQAPAVMADCADDPGDEQSQGTRQCHG